MRKVAVPIGTYTSLMLAYLWQSDAPFSVHILSLTIFAVAFLLPALWAARVANDRNRLVICGGCALSAMVAWDATAHLVIAKAEFFSTFLNTTFAYLVNGTLLAMLSFFVAWLASPLKPSFKATQETHSAE